MRSSVRQATTATGVRMKLALPTSSISDHVAIRDALADAGAVSIGAVEGSSDLLELGNSLGIVVPHRDSGEDKVTAIEDRGARSPGMAGFTRRHLPLHTDRSGTSDPPGVLITACAREPTSGGDIILADGQAIYEHLAKNSPAALNALSASRSAMFGGADGHIGSVFAKMPDGRVVMRYRDDGLVRYAPAATPYIDTLREAISLHCVTLPAQAGLGYAINNRRWLHGRLPFEGPRIMYRVLVNVFSDVIAKGFRADCDKSFPGGSRRA